jgi:uncharacterized phage-like protein YoqJ
MEINRYSTSISGMEINKTCCFTGLSPEECKGSEKAISKALRKEILKAIEDGYDTFISGIAPGVDQLAASEVIDIRDCERPDIKLICATPYPGFEESKGL